MGLFGGKEEVKDEEYIFELEDTTVGFIKIGRYMRYSVDNIIKYKELGGNKIELYIQDYEGGNKVIRKFLIKTSITDLDALLNCKFKADLSSEEIDQVIGDAVIDI